MATLAQLREYVRRQTETTDSELPNETIDAFLREGFNRTINRVNRWPFYESRWVLTVPADAASLPLPADVNTGAITSLHNLNARLQMITQEAAQDLYLPAVVPNLAWYEFSIWGRELFLWPKTVPTVDTELVLLGYRLPRDWVSQGDAAEVDADARLHWPLAHYAIALAYAQQEDEVLETTYMTRWQNDVDVAISSIMEPAHDTPLTMGGGKRVSSVVTPAGLGTLGWRWTPDVAP